jgi:hypothetical protein
LEILIFLGYTKAKMYASYEHIAKIKTASILFGNCEKDSRISVV